MSKIPKILLREMIAKNLGIKFAPNLSSELAGGGKPLEETSCWHKKWIRYCRFRRVMTKYKRPLERTLAGKHDEQSKQVL